MLPYSSEGCHKSPSALCLRHKSYIPDSRICGPDPSSLAKTNANIYKASAAEQQIMCTCFFWAHSYTIQADRVSTGTSIEPALAHDALYRVTWANLSACRSAVGCCVGSLPMQLCPPPPPPLLRGPLRETGPVGHPQCCTSLVGRQCIDHGSAPPSKSECEESLQGAQGEP